MGLLVAVEAYVADFCHGNKGPQAVNHTQSGTQYRHDGEFQSGNLLGRHLAKRGLDLHVLERNVAGHLIAHQKGDLVQQLAEIL